MNEATFTSDAKTPRAWPSMAEHKPLRFAATMILYFMQGVPLGLTFLVLPPWFAVNGAGPLEIGAFVGFATLPWSLKPFAGFLMDRYAYRPMGRRRAWILIAQASMVAVLLALATSRPGAADIALLGSFCFALNMCAIFNDVAVDGMTIDIVPVEERGAINGCMYGSQIVGTAVTGYLGGQLVLNGGTVSTALILSVLVAIPSLIVGSFRERPGERLMPWTSGKPSAECEALQQDAWWPILRGVIGSLASLRIVAYLAAFVLMSATWIQIDTIGPTLAVQSLSWTSDDYSTFAAIATLLAGVISIVSTGLLIKWFGMVRMATLAACVLICLSMLGGFTFATWEGSDLFMTMYVAQAIFVTFLTVILIAWGMMLSNPAVAASQFAIIMAVPNFGRTSMSGASGKVIESVGYGGTYFVTAALTAAGLLLFLYAASGKAPPSNTSASG